MNYVKPTPVQKYSIPIGMNGMDMMACAQTGSGKTAGFLLPLIASMLKKGGNKESKCSSWDGNCSYISALILAPTRELAMQIYEETEKFCYCTGILPAIVYGGVNIESQQRILEKGVDVLVATPGRLIDFIERRRISLCDIQFLVLDEADRMLDMGFEPQIRRIVLEEDMTTNRQTFMFSATFPIPIQHLASTFMKKDYVFLTVGRVGAASENVIQRIDWVESNKKMSYIIDYLKIDSMELVLIFVETKRGADELEKVLIGRGYRVGVIHGNKAQFEREKALKSFKLGLTPILVATDVAARGLDIPNVTQVINYDMPSNIDDYVHRIGRTGRVGNVGHAMSMMNDRNSNIAIDLVNLLIENNQLCPEWLRDMASSKIVSDGAKVDNGDKGNNGKGNGDKGNCDKGNGDKGNSDKGNDFKRRTRY